MPLYNGRVLYEAYRCEGWTYYHNFDYLVIMDENNARNLKRIIGDDVDSKVYKAMSFVGESRDVKDPWYTGNFDETFEDVSRSCDALLELIKEKI